MNRNADKHEDIYYKALKIDHPDRRSEYLREACGRDKGLLKRVEALLRANERAGDFLAGPCLGEEVTLDTNPLTETTGTVIGRYKILEKIGEGGMAVVYMAEQKQPIDRRVAIKLIKLGMDTREVIGRFEAERQALAMMDHPNIAKVLDAGSTEGGRPFFVMELVRGLPITEFCDKNHLTTQERLRLFVFVCNAVHHAHQKGIVHRDLKPSNIMVTLHDGEPVVKVIDFGIAKALNQRLTEKTVFTRYAQMIGTPEYMSPEQAEMSGLDIDTRTDVFSLGVLLYEMLTGSTPFDSEYLLSKGYAELQRIIREEEPDKPSTRISTLGDALTEIAKHRRTTPELLGKLIRSDLDWIVMKTQEKDRSRRYESVSELAADIKRHLDHETVLAGRPSTAYRLQKFVRRNQALCVSSVAVVVILALAVIVSTYQAWVAHQARKAEVLVRKTVESERDRAKDAEQRAEREQARAEVNLYDSLIREAQATRIARKIRYRDKVFHAIRQARDLDVPQKNLADLRREVVACLGDFVGFKPKKVYELSRDPQDLHIWQGELHPVDTIVALGLSDGTVLLRDTATDQEIFRFDGEYPPRGLCFSEAGNTLLTLHTKDAYSVEEQLSKSVARFFAQTQDGAWEHQRDMVVPGAWDCFPVKQGFYVCRIDEAIHDVRIIELSTGRTVHILDYPVHMNTIPMAAVSPDGQLLAVAIDDPSDPLVSVVIIHDLSLGHRVAQIEPRLSGCSGMNFSSDGKYLAFLSSSGGVIYETKEFRQIGRRTEQFMKHFADVSFLINRSIAILSTGKSQKPYIWDWESNEYLATIEDDTLGPVWTEISPDGRTLMTYGLSDVWLYTLDVSSERVQMSGHTAGVPGIAFSPNGNHLASIAKDRTLRVWNSKSGVLQWEQQLGSQGQGVAYSDDGRWIVSTELRSDRITIWNAESGEQILVGGGKRHMSAWAAHFSPDSRSLVSATAGYGDGAVTLWDCKTLNARPIASGNELTAVHSIRGPVKSLARAPDGRHFAFVTFDQWMPQELYLSDFSGSRPPRLITGDICGSAQMVTFTPDSRQMLIIDGSWQVVTYDVSTGSKVASFPTLHAGNLANSMKPCLSSDGIRLAISSNAVSGVDLIHRETGDLLYTLPGKRGGVYWLAWSPDGQRLAVSYDDGQIDIWNISEVERVLSKLGLAPVAS